MPILRLGRKGQKVVEIQALMTHSSGLIAAMGGSKDVTEFMVRFVCEVLKTWGFSVCTLKCQNEPA